MGSGFVPPGLAIVLSAEGEMSMDDTTPTCDYCNDPLEAGEGEFSWNCINPDCQAQFEFQEGRMVLIAAPVGEQ